MPKPAKRGRPRIYCGRPCGQRAYEARRLAHEYPDKKPREIVEHKRAVRAAQSAIEEAVAQAEWELIRRLAAMRAGVVDALLEAARSKPSPKALRELIGMVKRDDWAGLRRLVDEPLPGSSLLPARKRR